MCCSVLVLEIGLLARTSPAILFQQNQQEEENPNTREDSEQGRRTNTRKDDIARRYNKKNSPACALIYLSYRLTSMWESASASPYTRANGVAWRTRWRA